MVSQQKCVTQMMSLRTGDNSYDIPWMFYFLSSYVTVCTSYIHWKLCRCLYCFYPIIFSAKYKRSMLNYFAAVIVWKTAWWDYETIEERWNSKVKRTWRFLKKSVPTKIHIQTIDRKNVATRNKKTLELNDLLLNLCSTQKWNTNIRCRRMIPWNPEFTVDLPRMKAKIVWVTVTSLLYCLARKKEKTRLAALKIHV